MQINLKDNARIKHHMKLYCKHSKLMHKFSHTRIMKTIKLIKNNILNVENQGSNVYKQKYI